MTLHASIKVQLTSRQSSCLHREIVQVASTETGIIFGYVTFEKKSAVLRRALGKPSSSTVSMVLSKPTLLEHMHQLCLEENLVICNSCLKACDKAEAWQSSLIFLDGMTCLQIQKDLLSYGSAMRACQKALHWQLACHLFDQSASSNLVPDAFSYEAAITAYAAAGRALQTVALLWGLSNVLRLQNLREKSQRIQETP